MPDLNFLLAQEQEALLFAAQPGIAVDREKRLENARSFGRMVSLTSYPHRDVTGASVYSSF